MGSPKDDNAVATQLVLDALERSEINKISFQFGDVSVSPGMYQKVAKAITDQKITVMVAPNLLEEEVGAKYIQELKLPGGKILYDLIVLRTSAVGSSKAAQIEAEAGFIHECTHAGFNLLKVQNMTHASDETGAYTAEAIFKITRMISLGGDPEKVTIKEPIRSAAWQFATLILYSINDPTNKSYSSPDYAVRYYGRSHDLSVAIAKSDEYKDVASLPAPRPGVGRKWILPDTQGSDQTK